MCDALDSARVGAEQQREVVPADVVGPAEVQRSCQLEVEQLEQCLGEIANLDRRADLVDVEPRACARESLLRARLVAAVDERRADDRGRRMMRKDAALGLGLRPAVRTDRGDLVRLDVAAARPVEHQVAGEVQEAASHRGGRDHARPVDVRRPFVRTTLAVGGVHDGVDPAERGRHCTRVADVDPVPGTGEPFRTTLPPRGDDVDPVCIGPSDQLAAEEAAPAGDEEPCYQPRRSSRSLGSSDAVEIPTIASPRPAETSASTRASR